MDVSKSLESFAALGQETRLDAFRLLVKAGTKGMAAGEISAALGVKQNTMSANLSVLFQAGLVRNERVGRSIRYYANFEGLRGLLEFLMEDCCGGQPDLCRPVLDTLTCSC